MMGGDLNPLNWKSEHQAIWAVLIVLGGVAGSLFGWLVSPFSRSQPADMGILFLAWLHYPVAYWPWAAAGAVTAGLAYYSADLLTGSR